MAAGRIKGITIEIGANTTKLTSALAKVDSALSKTQTNLRDLNKALKFDPGNTNLLKDKQQELAKAIEETKSKLQTEKEAYEQLSRADKTPENVEKMRQLKTQIDLDTTALKELEAEAKQSASVLGSQFQAAGEKIQAVGEKIKDVGDKLQSIGSNLTTKVTAPIVAGFAAAVKTTGEFDEAMSKVQAVSGATASDMELLRAKAKEMGETSKFSAVESAEALNYMAMAGWKTEQMLNGLPGIMNLAAASGEELGTTSDIVTDALTAFGMQADESGRFADILAAAASNANTNVAMMGESFKYVAPVAGAMGYNAEDVAVALGLMANAGIKADMAGTSLRNMMQRMAKPTKESQAAMDRLGISLQDDQGNMLSFRQIMDTLRDSMVDINMSLEDYNFQLDLLDESLANGSMTQKKYDAALEELNKQAFGAEGAEQARAAAMLGGTRAMAGLLAISNASIEDYDKLTSAIDNSSQAFAKLADGSVVPLNEALASGQEIIEQYNGSAEAMANTMLDNLPGQITLLKSQIEGLAISFGEMLMPTVRKVVGGIQEFVDKLNAMDESQREQIIKIAAIVAAIGPVLIIIGKVVGAISTIVTVGGKLVTFVGGLITKIGGLQGVITALTGPIGIIIAAIGALVAAFVYFYNTNEEFRNRVNAVIEEVKVAFQGFVENVKVWIDQILAWFAPIIESVSAYLTALWELITTIVQNIVASVKEKLDAHALEISALISTIQLIIESVLTVLQEFITTKLDIIKSIFTGVLNILTNLIKAFTFALKGDWKSAMDYLAKAAKAGVDMVKNIFNELKEGISNIFHGLIENFRSWGQDMMDGLIGGIMDKIEAVKEVAGTVAGAIKEFLHFSEPDVGPLSDFHTYAPDMMALFAQGIRDNAHLITDAIGTSFDLRPYFTSMTNGLDRLTSATDRSISAPGQQGPIVVNVSLEGDANRLFRVLSEEAHKDWQITGTSKLMGY